MQFEQYKTPSNKFAIYINPEGAVFPTTEPEQIETLTKLLYFDVDTYDSLKSGDRAAWDVVFKSINGFLHLLDKEAQDKIIMTFIMMHMKLVSMDKENMLDTIDGIGALLDDLDKNISLCDKLKAYVESSIPIQSFESAGSRPQDSTEMTFNRHHVVELTTIAMLCKLMTPIYGQFFHKYKSNNTVDKSIKEIHCRSMLNQLFERKYHSLIIKLINFICRIIKSVFKIDIVTAYSGTTLGSQTLNGLSTILTRKFITVDLYKPDGNLMTYITACLKNAVKTQYSTVVSRNSVKERDAKTLKDMPSDEGNASRLEVESRTSSKTADIPIIIEWGVDQLTKSILKKFNVRERDYIAAISYYESHLSPPTPISNYLLCTYFGGMIDGAAGISMISAIAYNKLIVCLQFILINKGYLNLVHAISLQPTIRVKALLTSTDNKVRMTWSNTHAFKNFKQRFPFGVGDKECDGKLKEIVEFITTRVHMYNTAPIISDLLNEESMNGSEYVCQADIVESMCDFINTVTEKTYT